MEIKSELKKVHIDCYQVKQTQKQDCTFSLVAVRRPDLDSVLLNIVAKGKNDNQEPVQLIMSEQEAQDFAKGVLGVLS